MEEYLQRYNDREKGVISDYWEVIRWTRRHGKISNKIKLAEMDYWSKFEPDIVISALETHIAKYPKVRESYTRGIMRNMAEQKSTGITVGYVKKAPSKPTRFHNYEPRKWDYDRILALEQAYLDKKLERTESDGEKD